MRKTWKRTKCSKHLAVILRFGLEGKRFLHGFKLEAFASNSDTVSEFIWDAMRDKLMLQWSHLINCRPVVWIKPPICCQCISFLNLTDEIESILLLKQHLEQIDINQAVQKQRVGSAAFYTRFIDTFSLVFPPLGDSVFPPGSATVETLPAFPALHSLKSWLEKVSVCLLLLWFVMTHSSSSSFSLPLLHSCPVLSYFFPLSGFSPPTDPVKYLKI